MSSNFKKQRLDVLSERLRKAKEEKGKPPKTEAEKQINHNNLPRPEDKKVTKDEYFDKIWERYSQFTDILVPSAAALHIIEGWWSEGIPLRVVLIGMENLITKYYRLHGREIRVRSLEYFRQEVESTWEAYKELRVGANR